MITLSKAIYKMTQLPATTLGVTSRGSIKEGLVVDTVIFDPAKIIDKAAFEAPHQYPEGISYVIINGQAAVEEGLYKNLRPGVVLYGAHIANY